MKEAIHIGAAMSNAIERLEALGEAARKRRAELEAFAADKPQDITCEAHNVRRWLNMDASSRATWEAGKFVLVYDACPDCQASEGVRYRNRWLVNAGVPSILSEATLDNWKPRSEADRALLWTCREFVTARHGILIMTGKHGLGKSHLGAAILRACGRGKFWRQRALLRELRKTYSRDSRAQDIIEICQRTPLLILDEMVEPESRDEWPMVEEILEYRHSERMKTVITTNTAGVAEFRGLVGDRIFDRLRQSAFNGKIMEFTGESLRPQLKAEY